MRASFLQKITIIAKIATISIYKSLLVIGNSLFFKNKEIIISGIIHDWAIKILAIAKVNYQIFIPSGFEFKLGRPYIIMSNHASHFDIPLIYTTFLHERVGMVAKKELFRIPIFGWGMKLGGCISIDRENKQRALYDLTIAKKMMQNGVRVWIAPEGTRSATGELGSFKKGGFKIALDSKAIILPVTIVGSNRILPAKTFEFSLQEKIKVYVNQPIDTENYESTDLKKLMLEIANIIKTKLKVNED